MEKISGIIPKSPRTTSVDEQASLPARPGSPSAGRAVGTSDLKDRVTRSTLAKAKDIGEVAGYGRNMKEAQHAKIAEEMSRKFFMKESKPLAPEQLVSAEAIQVPVEIPVVVTVSKVNPNSSTEETR